MKLTRIFNLLLILTVLCAGSCSKGSKDAPDTDTEEPSTNNTATFTTAGATPGTQVIVETSFPLTASSYKITVGGKPVTLVKLDEKQAGFIMPLVSQGAVNVDLSSLGLKTQSYTVGTYTVITQPQLVIDGFVSDLNKAVTQLETRMTDTIQPISAEKVNLVKNLRANFNALYATMNADEKQELAYGLQKFQFDFSDPLVNGRKVNDAAMLRDPGDDIVTLGKVVVTNVTLTVSAISISIIGFYAPEPTLVSKVLGLAAGAYAAASFAQTLRLTEKLAETIGQQFNFKIFSSTNGRLASATAMAKEGFVDMMNKVPLKFTFESEFHSLSKQDVARGNAFVNTLFTGIDNLGNNYNKLVSAINYAKSWFSDGPPALTPFVSPVRATPLTAIRPTPSDNITINNVSVTDIQVTFVRNTDNTVTIKAASETVKEVKDFSFDVVYTNTELGISNKLKVNATFQPVTNEWIAKLLGTWKIDYYLRMSPATYQQYVDDYNNDPYGKTYEPAGNNSIRITNMPTEVTFHQDSTFGGVGNYPYGYQQHTGLNNGSKWEVNATGTLHCWFPNTEDQVYFHILGGQLEVVDATTMKVKVGMYSCNCEEPYTIMKKK